TQAQTSGAGTAHPEHLGHVIFIAAAAAMGGFLFGYDSSVINGAVEAIRDRYDIGSAALAQVIAVALIGCAIGAATAGRIADRIGRIRCMQIAAVLFTISAVGSALPFALWDLAFWRIVGGFAIGMASVIGPAYIAEVAPPAYRGRLGSFQQAAIVVGIAISQLVNWGLLNAAGGDQRGTLMGLEAWQVMLGVMVVPAVLYGMLSFAIPESPRFLLSVGKRDRAREILAEVEGQDIDLGARVAEIEHAMTSEHKSTFKDLLGGGFFFKPIVWIGIGLSVFQQFVGINVAFYYSSTLWQSVGVDPADSFFYSFTTSIINIVGTVIAMIFVDRVGRKPLALIGSIGMAVGLALEAWAFSSHLVDGKLPATQGWVALVAAHVFVLFFALSWGVVVWVMLGEMFPN
ncbi:sugar porter family MFS transporter, partial [Streptomyces sp. MK5]|uniref:sugar porter family MFS transporter n=1 Tax=Streptomyces sp. MK5 TaxID=3064253 RepID=UPI0027426FED